MSGLGFTFPSSPAAAELLPPSVVWTGASRRTYETQLHLIGTQYVAVPGVYIFCKQALSGNWDALYIGETSSFARRLSEELHLHHCWKRIVNAGASHICTLRVLGDLALREGIETDLRRLINPPLNLQ